jgi:asparagine synthase (glutamine-hydrolysing)
MRNAVLASQGVAAPKMVTFGLADLEKMLPTIAYHLDTPATWTAVCQWFMDKQIAEDGAVVVFSGEGADELFGGYTRYRFLWWLQQITRDPNLSAYGPMQLALFGDRDEAMARMLNRGGRATEQNARAIVERFDVSNSDDLCAAMARVDFYTTMQCLLRMADRMAAAHSLENRSPFLDYRVMELAARMPTWCKINEDESKAVLRNVARRLGVPSEIIDEKTKRGLFLPWAQWKGAGGVRGVWDRGSFAAEMHAAWRRAFF